MFFQFAFVALASLALTWSQSDTTTENTIQGSSDNTEIGLSEQVYQKVYSYTKNSRIFKNYTYEETKAYINDLDKWVDPINLRKLFPYYLSGYDYERRPVWILEAGKYNFRRIIEQGQEDVQIGYKYMVQMVLNFMKSTVVKDAPGDEIREALLLLDMQDFDLRQVTFLPFWAEFVKVARLYGDLIIQVVGRVVLINANYATKTGADIARPLVGRLFERIEVYGNGEEYWRPRLLKLFPIEVLPSWYGGNKNYTPVSIHG